MLQNFLLRKMIKSQLKGIPENEQDRIIALVESNPELFKKIAEEAQAKIKQGKDQQAAVLETFKEHQEELSKLNLQ